MSRHYLSASVVAGEAESSEDTVRSSELLEAKLASLAQALSQLNSTTDAAYCKNRMEAGYVLLDLERKAEAWQLAHEVLPVAISSESWLHAVEACDIIYQAEQNDSVVAIGHGIWLGVTFPIDTELTIAMLEHLINDSPDRSDGAAVAAAVANYIVDLRVEDEQVRNHLKFYTMQLLGDVARRHSQVEEQEIFDFWVERLELNDPAKCIPRLGQVVEALVEEQWWFDREAIRAKIPESP
ncbi:hypothetical protein D5085_01965 [Ectothiorhodospiraceae bacterium BW-2]|nr:hypothetical protein D5085_01965 [Ectothiorhodospiraceae bacterium BW-2]